MRRIWFNFIHFVQVPSISKFISVCFVAFFKVAQRYNIQQYCAGRALSCVEKIMPSGHPLLPVIVCANKDPMHRFLFVLLLLHRPSLFPAVKDCFYNARVIEYDYCKCACCGGLVVEVDDGHTYQAFRLSRKPFTWYERSISLRGKYRIQSKNSGRWL